MDLPADKYASNPIMSHSDDQTYMKISIVDSVTTRFSDLLAISMFWKHIHRFTREHRIPQSLIEELHQAQFRSRDEDLLEIFVKPVSVDQLGSATIIVRIRNIANMKLQKRLTIETTTITALVAENFKRGRDRLYEYQVSLDGPFAPYALNQYSLIAAGICSDVLHFAAAIRQLAAIGVLSNHGIFNTSKLNSRIMAQSYTTLSTSQQRDLRVLLFWWDQECVRLSRLLVEEADLGACLFQIELSRQEIDVLIDDNDEEMRWNQELKFAREQLRMRIRQRPRERLETLERMSTTVQPVQLRGAELAKPPPYHIHVHETNDPLPYLDSITP